MKWYYQSEGREVGPLTETALQELTASGVINQETPVRREDSTEWQPCSIVFSQKNNPQQEPAPSSNKHLFKFECPHCQQHISTDEDCSGQSVQCPTCSGEFVVPSDPEKVQSNTSSTSLTEEGSASSMKEEEHGQPSSTILRPPSTNVLGKSAKKMDILFEGRS